MTITIFLPLSTDPQRDRIVAIIKGEKCAAEASRWDSASVCEWRGKNGVSPPPPPGGGGGGGKTFHPNFHFAEKEGGGTLFSPCPPSPLVGPPPPPPPRDP